AVKIDPILSHGRKSVPTYQVPSRSWLPEVCDPGSRNDPEFVTGHDKKALRREAEILPLNVTLPNLKSFKVMITNIHWMMDHEHAQQHVGLQVWSYEEKLSWAQFFRKTILGVVDGEEEERLSRGS
ncbi:MAG: hypothetical protein Q9183_005930, partial [Haloplaca sp. 2 TL-2023]